MSSSTTNSDFSPRRYRHYWRLLSWSLLPALCVLFATALYLQPVSGDLTRMGGYPENLFGWTTAQSRFRPPLSHRQEYNQYYDVVVFGDSFSNQHTGEQTDLGTYWHNFLAQKTGLTVNVFDTRRTDIQDVVESPVYASRPPRIVVFQHVERDLLYLPELPESFEHSGVCTPLPAPRQAPLAIRPLDVKAQGFERSAVYQPRSNNFPILDLDQAANVLKRRFMDDLLGLQSSDALRFPLRRSGLFSNQLSDQLLVYKNELNKAGWKKPRIDAARCRLVALQNYLQSNGETLALIMLSPDRLTAYGSYLLDQTQANLSRLDDFSVAGLNLLRVDRVLKQAIDSGEQDVYLPNDTHWGVKGHQIAAQRVLEVLRESAATGRLN